MAALLVDGTVFAQRRPELPGGTTTEASPPVKLSRNGICHPRSGAFYSRTLYFAGFRTMAECIRAGGRPAKV